LEVLVYKPIENYPERVCPKCGGPLEARRVINGFTGEELGKVWICDRCGYEENMISDSLIWGTTRTTEDAECSYDRTPPSHLLAGIKGERETLVL
jgi:predicted RNA-binding Zn-ribbon protein involved in translation (DUF1610 family)